MVTPCQPAVGGWPTKPFGARPALDGPPAPEASLAPSAAPRAGPAGRARRRAPRLRGRLGGPGILANSGYSCCLHPVIPSGATAMSLNGPSLTGLRRVLAEDRNYARIQAEAARGFAARSEDYQISAPAGMRSTLLAEMADGLATLAGNEAGPAEAGTAEPGSAGAGRGVPVVLAVTATGREAEDLTEALRAFLPADAVAEFPSWETLPHERLSPRSDTVGRRLSVLRRLAHPESSTAARLRVVVAPVRAVVQPVVAGLGDLVPVTLKVGQDVPFTSVVKSLADAAYARVDMVTHRGEFAVRGGIIDVFPPTED